MNNDIIDQILTDEEQLAWQKIQHKLSSHINEIYLANLEQLDQSIPSGTKYLQDPVHPQHVTSAPREITIRVHAEISTINENHQLENINQIFNHYYHIAVPAETDYRDNLMKFVELLDDGIQDYATKININK